MHASWRTRWRNVQPWVQPFVPVSSTKGLLCDGLDILFCDGYDTPGPRAVPVVELLVCLLTVQFGSPGSVERNDRTKLRRDARLHIGELTRKRFEDLSSRGFSDTGSTGGC